MIMINLSDVRQVKGADYNLSKIVHQNITQQVIEYMKEHIESGSWVVGEKIPSENELTAELGVSRSSVRQAISHFVGIGVLETQHGKGTFLVDNETDGQSNEYKITAEDCKNVEKVLEFRRILESEACLLATQNKTPELVKQLTKYVKTMKESREDVSKYVSADISFHKAISHASGNTLLEKSLNKVFRENKKSQVVTWRMFGYQDGIHYHEQILQAIEQGDAETAKRLMYEHMQNGIEKIKNQ